MFRQKLKTYKGLVVTADVAEALRLLENKANERGKWRVKYPPQPRATPDILSLVPAGREVHFVFEKAGVTALEALHAAWGCAVPLGFTPKLRYPLLEHGSQVFHFLGLWQGLYGVLLAEGRGHLAWPSVCCAAQVDVGAWSGDKEEVRFVQAQLHRLGRNCGPIDGVVGQRTAAAIESLALLRGSLTLVVEHLRVAEPPPSTAGQTGRGHLLLSGCQMVVEGYGGIKAWPMQNGAGIEVSGPGRLVVDVR